MFLNKNAKYCRRFFGALERFVNFGKLFCYKNIMDSPFIYDKYVTGKNFIGRKGDCAILSNMLVQGENICIYEPPRSGKTSLVQQTLFNMRMSGKQFLAGEFSALSIRTAEAFVCALGSTVVRMLAATPSEYGEIIGRYLGGTHFVFDPGNFSDHDEVVSMNWDLEPSDIEAMLRLPYRLARDRRTRMILIIDEFQDILLADGGDDLLREMDRIVKDESPGSGFSYIFSGSMVNAMKDIFEVKGRFYRHVERVTLQKVDEREIADHVIKGFLSSGKVMERNLLLGACRLLRNNLWYINHFVAICDSKSKGYIMEPVLVEALSSIISLHEWRFRDMMNGLTTHQVNLLRAIVDGCTKFSGSEVVRKYSLNSSANVKRVKDALMKKEIVTFTREDEPVILDPLFEYWVKKHYFGIKD